MKVQIVSDLHLDHYNDPMAVLKEIHTPFSDVLVIAGDITTNGQDVVRYLKEISKIFALHDIIYVPGNHDFYGGSIHAGLKTFKEHIANNIHVLYNDRIELGNQEFFGTTLWFKDDPMNTFYPGYPDYNYIDFFKATFGQENETAIKWLGTYMNQDSIVITHFMSHPIFVADQYKGDEWNRYFLCDIDNLISKYTPKIVVCGHTHEGTDQEINWEDRKTRFICNPYGYPFESCKRTYKNVIVEV